MRKHHSNKMMENDIPRYHLHDVVCTSDSEGMVYNVKKDLYRQPERLLCILFLIFGIDGVDVYEGIDELSERGFIDAELKKNLIKSISIACELRLRAYFDQDRQLEELDIPWFISRCSETVETPKALVTKAPLDRLVAFYRIVLPFSEKVMEMKCETNDETRPSITLKHTELKHAPSYYNALIHLRLLRYDDAKYFSMRAIHANPADPTNWKVLARLLEKQGKYAEAFLCQLKSFYIHFLANEEILNLSLESSEKQDIPGGATRLASGIRETLVNTARPDMHFLLWCFQKMGLSSLFSSQYQRAWRFFRIVYYLLQKFPYLRRGDALPSVLSNIALCLKAAGRYDEAIGILKFILKDEGFLSAIQVPKVRDNLGNAYFYTGNYLLALNEYRRALKQRRSYYRSSNSPFLVISLLNIANVLSKMGQLVESTVHYQEALKVTQRIFANPHAIYSAFCLSGIGKNLISLGKYGEALGYCERSVEIARVRKHRNRRTYAMVLVSLGNCYLFLKRFNDAVIAYEQSASVFQSVTGMDVTGQEEATVLPNEIAMTYCNLAVALQQQGKFHSASRWLQRSEEMIASCMNRECHSDMGVILHARGQVLQSQGKAEEAKEAMEKSLEIFTKAFGKDCPHFLTVKAMIDLGNLLVSQRQFMSAVEQYCEALRLVYSDTVSKDAFIQVKICAHKNMGYSHYQMKQIPQAITCYKEALNIWTFTQNENSSNDVDKSLILSLHVEAGNAYIRGGNLHQAIKLYEVAVSSTPISVSHGVCDLKQVAWTLASMQQKTGLHLEAIESFQRAIFLHAESGKVSDTFVVKCYQHQATLYQTLGDQENACLLAEKALGIHLAITNSQPCESTVKLLSQVAETWSHRDTQKALEFCRRSVQIIEKLGAPAALECNVLSDLGFYCHLNGLKEAKNLTEQRRLFEEAEASYNRALSKQRNEPTLFNMSFLLMSTFRFVAAITLLNGIFEISDKHSKVGLDGRDAKVMNPKLRDALFSRMIQTKAVVRSMVLAHCLKFQCYKALEDDINARSEASKLIEYLTDVENPEESDHKLFAFTLEELEKLES